MKSYKEGKAWSVAGIGITSFCVFKYILLYPYSGTEPTRIKAFISSIRGSECTVWHRVLSCLSSSIPNEAVGCTTEVCVCVCVLCPVMDWHCIQGVFPSHIQGMLWIHCNTDHDKALTMNERINKWRQGHKYDWPKKTLALKIWI